ncbi:MAG: hypothetical protein WC768_03950 [Patescibacteria group bacterium]|jgi:hypothetical protein
MTFKLPKIKIFNVLLSLKYFYFLMLLLVIAVLIFVGLFLYKNFYQTITQSQEIILLRQEVAPDVINMDKVEKILKLLDQKATTTEEINWQDVKNPFIFQTAPKIESPEISANPPAVKN